MVKEALDEMQIGSSEGCCGILGLEYLLCKFCRVSGVVNEFTCTDGPRQCITIACAHIYRDSSADRHYDSSAE